MNVQAQPLTESVGAEIVGVGCVRQRSVNSIGI